MLLNILQMLYHEKYMELFKRRYMKWIHYYFLCMAVDDYTKESASIIHGFNF
jgi:hypothetical protein